MLSKLKTFFFEKSNTIRFELDDWYDWYKDPQKFHNAVVEHLVKEGKIVQTIHVKRQLNSNKISILLIDGKKYQLSISGSRRLGHVQSVVLKELISR